MWPIEERKVEQGTLSREWYSPTQPFPTKPPAFERNGFSEDMVIHFTPELRAEGLKILKDFKIGPIYTLPIAKGEGGRSERCSSRTERTGRAARSIPKPA